MANMFRSHLNSKEINSQFIKLSNSKNYYNAMNIEVSKVSSMLTPACGWASVLIVDDQIINRYALCSQLRLILNEFGARYRIRSDEAENGKIGRRVWLRVAFQMYSKQLKKNCCNGYRLVLMDLNMPVMNGIKASQKILETETEKPKPVIIAVTGFTSDDERDKCFRAGISDVKYKPISVNTYLEVVLSIKR